MDCTRHRVPRWTGFGTVCEFVYLQKAYQAQWSMGAWDVEDASPDLFHVSFSNAVSPIPHPRNLNPMSSAVSTMQAIHFILRNSTVFRVSKQQKYRVVDLIQNYLLHNVLCHSVRLLHCFPVVNHQNSSLLNIRHVFVSEDTMSFHRIVWNHALSPHGVFASMFRIPFVV